MEKLYVNEIRPDGEVSTVGLFYSQAEAEKIVAMLQSNRDRLGCCYEIVAAVRHVLPAKPDSGAHRAGDPLLPGGGIPRSSE
jgi:hypothetical protein